MQALYQKIPSFRAAKQPTGRQRIIRPGIAKPSLVRVKSGST